MTRWLTLFLGVFTLTATLQGAEDRDTKVRNDRNQVEAIGSWIYNDLAQGFTQAKASGKPLLVVFRCVP